MALFRCGSGNNNSLTASNFTEASGSTSVRTISNVKKDDVIFLNISQAYANYVRIINAIQIGDKLTWHDGAGSTWGFDMVIQATVDGTVTINSGTNGIFYRVKYSIASLN